ncbi:DNA-binding protein YbaB [Saccharothrix coeruleofusca]|uniref:YbaB/EbfC family nucleoid-associated protein n=1 Tax=Saccharothrix coeruleofusca TaxID=33919 RepID=UPI001AE948B3|nr:YbaB/EbfC family nucleoid-associated protein [Saccharothrix coeruleofusca]MBP2337422.1 DNA-binding protein YbaB [Saccharothrix coeruleofusca]
MADQQRRLQDMMKSFQEQAAKAGQLQEAMKDLRGVGRSRDGAVVVTAAPSGAVLGLRLSPAAMGRSHVALQQEILDAIRAATQDAARQLDAAVAPILGDRLEQFKQGMAASGVEPIMPSAPPPPGPAFTPPPPAPPRTGPPPASAGGPPFAPPPGQPQRNRPAAAPVEDDEPPSTYLR